MLKQTEKELQLLATAVIRTYFEEAKELKDKDGDPVLVMWLDAKQVLVNVLKDQQIIQIGG